MQKTVIVIPCYNEEKRLDTNVFKQALEKFHWLNFIFVDDGSSDNTKILLEEMACVTGRVEVQYLVKNVGKAEAVRKGLIQAFRSDCVFVGYWDADLSTSLDEVELLQNELTCRDMAVAYGARIRTLGRNIKRSRLRHYQGRVFATVVSLITKVAVYDTQCGAKLFRVTSGIKQIFQVPFKTRWVFDVEILARLLLIDDVYNGKLLNDTAIEVPLPCWQEVGGSKLGFFSILIAVFDLFRIYFLLHHKKLFPSTQSVEE